MLKRRNRIYRRIAIALTVALLAGQSYAFVLAEENVGDVPQTEISSGEIGADRRVCGGVYPARSGSAARSWRSSACLRITMLSGSAWEKMLCVKSFYLFILEKEDKMC